MAYNRAMATGSDKATALWVVRTLVDAGHEALFAGGCVRDMLLGVDAHDYDVATSATPDDVKSLFRRVLMVGAQPTGVSFDAAVPLEETPGVGIPAVHQVGFAVLGRIGAVRCNKT